MTREELLSALELTPDPSPGSYDLDGTKGPATPSAPPSPTALQLDDWSLRRGAESLRGDILGPILAPGHQDPVTINGTPVEWIPPPDQSLIAADCLAAAFEPEPRLAANCADETRGRYFRQLMETEAYQALHAQTRLDTLASELAAGHFAQGYVALVQQEQQQQESAQGAPQSPQEQQRQEMRNDLRALSAAANALQNAAQDVDDLRDAQRAMGDDPSNPTHLDPSALKARFDRIRQSGRLRAIIEHAGRYRRLAQAKQRQKTRHGQDDVVGVELGADLGRLLPAELAALADPDLELDALRRYLERGLMQRELRGTETKARGPIVVVVDESGSMSGDRIETAKALALAMAWVARHQRRYCCLVGFADDSNGNWLVIPPGHTDQDALLDWLGHFYSGGTSAAVPLVTLPNRWEQIGAPRGQTDVILITDGLLSFDDGTRDRFNAWKRAEQVKLFTLIIDEPEPGDLETVSDRVWTLPDLSIDTDAVQEIVSL